MIDDKELEALIQDIENVGTSIGIDFELLR